MNAALAIYDDAARDEAPAAPPAGAAAATADWQRRLVGLLARLEHLRSGLDGLTLGRDALAVLDRAEAMVHAAEAFAGEGDCPADLGGLQMQAVARAGAFLTAAAAVRGPLAAGFFRSLWTALSGGQPPSCPASEVRECLLAAIEALHDYFALFTRTFPSSTAARGWVDAACVFLAEFKRLARDLPA